MPFDPDIGSIARRIAQDAQFSDRWTPETVRRSIERTALSALRDLVHEANATLSIDLSDKPKPLQVGDKLYGYCGGFFGRDSYDDKIVEYISPERDVVVARDSYGHVHTAVFNEQSTWSIEDLQDYRTPDAE